MISHDKRTEGFLKASVLHSDYDIVSSFFYHDRHQVVQILLGRYASFN